jgi:hypothetical protein
VYSRFAEHGHYRIADELLQRTAMALDARLHPLEVASQQRPQRLRVGRLPSAVEPTTSQKSTVTTLRCSDVLVATATPHSGQNLNAATSS